ncbi:putative exo-1,4-beta-xylosidase xlnD [Lachnellula suecica]|uniref:xylan 1,4-beta-xylosidase n=1 Tax=Lachnellula suecica TaxID=602035 RepID=A0A8T9C8K7_9HELO|nr:putative exo-1,4-beta-xylosidase xlnD [Lachnellula suecica]
MSLSSYGNPLAVALIPPFATNTTELLSVLTEATVIRTLPNCAQDPLRNLTICNTSLSPPKRATSLVNLLTLEEKINASIFYLPEVPRLGIPPYTLWNEALHGLGTSTGVDFAPNGSYSVASNFPEPLLMAAAFDDDLVEQVAIAISIEGRAFGNVGRAGMDYYAPNINPFRDPRWGRGQETPGEDAFRVSGYTKAFVTGLEGPSSSKFKRGIATCKHFAAYDLENYHNVTRFNFDAQVSTQDLADYYTPPFQACARDAKASAIMCSYNSVNGIPACLDPYLLQTVLREHWNWDAADHYVTTDCFALDVAFDSHNYTSTPEQTAADALKAGTDTDCGIFFPTYLPRAFAQGLVAEQDLDRALTRVYAALIKLGYYDPPETQPYGNISFQDVNTPATQKLARQAATSGMTLFKNSNKTLPLSAPTTGNGTLSIALVGEWSNATTEMLGGYAGAPPFIHSPLYGLQQTPGISVNLVVGVLDSVPVLAAAESSDIILYVGGIDNSIEQEGLDRVNITWNATKTSLITSLARLGKPFIIAQSGGGQLDDTAFLANPNISSILWIGYPGQDGGVALADVLFGIVAPAGRLPVTMYPESYVSVPPTDMSLRPNPPLNPGRTYKWFDDAVLPFGYGLHYTNFSATASLTFPMSQDTTDILKFSNNIQYTDQFELGNLILNVTNIGDVKSDYAALAFVSGEYGPLPRPIRELAAYSRLKDIEAGAWMTASLPIKLGALTRWDDSGKRVLNPGVYRLAIDTQPELAVVEFHITGSEIVVEQFPIAETKA